VSPLALQVRRVTGAVVGRPAELAAIQQELATARSGRLTALTVEGEPGIGKTRLLLSASELAAAQGFTTIMVAADEEIRGPFLLARSIVGSPGATSAAAGTPAAEPLSRCLDALSGQDDPSLASLAADQKLLRTFDLGAVAVRALAAERPLALLVDDLQWADDDSLRLIRYIIRADSASPLFLMAAIRPEELAFLTEAVNLIADMERMGMVRRMKVNRFSQVETTEFLKQVLAGKVDGASAATIHRQAEGVPFIVEEVARAYRETGMIQEFDGTWTLAKNAERLVPSAVRTLISRRAARLPDETKASLAEAAILGRHFSLKDLREVQIRVREAQPEPATEDLEEEMLPAVAAGLLVQHPESAAADYSFGHEQVREFAASSLSPARRRAIHAAIVELLMVGEPAPGSLPLLAHHAKAAGDAVLCVRFSLDAIKNALAAHAPEEVLRVVDLALQVATTPKDRVPLLQARDEAFEMLRRPADRLEGLAELAALADALGDSHLHFDVQLRRAAALRLSGEDDRAAELARRIQQDAAAASDSQAELAATLELGQAVMHTPIGETYTPSPRDVDLDAAEAAFARAAALAEELGDEPRLADSLRELGVVNLGRVRAFFVEQLEAGRLFEFMSAVTTGTALKELIAGTPAALNAKQAGEQLQRALEIYERLGDRRGAMSSVIAMAYLSWGPDIHLGSGAAHHIEEIRRLASRMDSFTKESERAQAEGQMLYGAHVFARAKVIPDLALSRGEDAYRHSRLVGDRTLEFAAAGGTAMAHLDVGDIEQAEKWIDRAAAAAAESPTPLRARQLETWRGSARAGAGDAEGMRRHLERAVELATEQGRPAARCEALALLALKSARLGVDRGDQELLAVAESSARDAKAVAELLTGHPPWGIEANAALAQVMLAKGSSEEAVNLAREAMVGLISARHEDLPVDAVIAMGRVMMAAASQPEQEMFRFQVGVILAMTAMRTFDEDARARWFRGPIGGELSRIVGPIERLSRPGGNGDEPAVALEESDTAVLRLLTQGRTNAEIAAELRIAEEDVRRRLAGMFAKIGASSRAEATAFAFRERVV
jgi:DNA-binding CsgD family transcriptional regulator/tetratricopeptide (TPR) repeat protein